MRLLLAARVLGATLLAAFGQVTSHQEWLFEGLGSWASNLLIIAMVIAAGLGILGFLRGRVWASPVALWALACGVGSLIPSLLYHPIKFGALILWLVYTGVAIVLGGRPSSTMGARPWAPPPPSELGQLPWHSAAQHLVPVSLTLILASMPLPIRQYSWVLLLDGFIVLLLTGAALVYCQHGIRISWMKAIWILASLAAAILTSYWPPIAVTFLIVFHLIFWAMLLSDHQLTIEIFELFYRAPAIFLILSFLLLIIVGALLLSLPSAAANGVAMAPMHALFTAVSAVCVTGLSVVDVSRVLSGFGQFILLGLIQLGGLGIMVISAFAMLSFGEKLGVRNDRILGDVLEIRGSKSAYRLVRFIVISTLIIEFVGALLLSFSYFEIGYSLPKALWFGIFHAVSAFCNAGFALHSQSLLLHSQKPLFLSTIMLLITMGGLGFFVLANIWSRLRGELHPLRSQTKIVLIATAVLTLVPTLLIAGVEWNRSLIGMPLPAKIFNAFFQSVTLRTAGFNSVDFGALHPATLSLMIGMMFIGAAPGGTGGGIKVTTAAVLFATVPAIVRVGGQATIFRRRISLDTILRSATLVVLTLSTIAIILFGLQLSHDLDYLPLLFETVSAVGTVGLSLGATQELNDFGLYLIMLAMFLGRIGPLTAVIAFARTQPSRIHLPEDRIMVG